MSIIAAIATGNAPTAIGIVRVSGAGCFALCDAVFQGTKPLSQATPRTMVYGDMLDELGQVIDRGLAVRFVAPHSYTGEDSVEFFCHGSPVVMQALLRGLFAQGAQQAKAGAFTQRAFLNGQLDLTQAQGVIDLIHSETVEAAKHAVAQVNGTLRRDFSTIYDGLLDISSQFYAVVDYPDEDIEDLNVSDIQNTLDTSAKTLQRLLQTCNRGQILKSGVPTAIVGRPNVGKSSLLNALLGYDRAIVTHVAGTTRDTLEERVVCGGVLLRLIDTAGIRDTLDPIEAMGVERSKEAVSQADLALVVLDGSQPFTPADQGAVDLALQAPHTIVVVNKTDLPQQVALPALSCPVVTLCAKEGLGLPELETAVADCYPVGAVPPGQMITDLRQQEAVQQAYDAIRRGQEGLLMGLTPDAILTDMEEALTAMGNLTGKTASDDIVARLFERFCVGK